MPSLLPFVFRLLPFLLMGALSASAQQQPEPTFTQIVVFGDSLSDTGNVRDRTDSVSGGLVDYPSHTFNYSNGRFTNDNATDPSAHLYLGVWHEQLAQTFLGLPAATYSLGGGTNYAFGGATTKNGTHDEVAVTTPFGDVTITINDMGKQMDDYLASHPIDPGALYVVWGGGNDFFDDDSAANVTATATRATGLMSRLAIAGAQSIMVPNVPPLGDIPKYANDPAKIVSLNAAAATYRNELNAALTASLSNLAAQGIHPTVYRVDAWTNTIRVMTYPDRYGFIDVRSTSQDRSSANPDQFLFWDDKHPTTAGHYWTAKGANDALTIPFVPPAKAINISTRLFVDLDERVSIVGFIVTGDAAKRILIRGIGPSLAGSGVPNTLANPTLTLLDSAGKPLRTNDNWRDSQSAEIIATGIPPQNDLEAAIVTTLTAGPYTAVLAGQSSTIGNGLVEVYDLEPGTNSTLANLSTRGFVGTGDNVMIGGLIVGAGDLPIVVVRALGPTLAGPTLANPLLDPTLELHDADGALIGSNDDWKNGQVQPVQATQLAPTDDRESAIVAFLAPGNYTAIVRGKAGATGVALVEAYRIP
jgi:phospholipase/lecithinase/hemolysin